MDSPRNFEGLAVEYVWEAACNTSAGSFISILQLDRVCPILSYSEKLSQKG